MKVNDVTVIIAEGDSLYDFWKAVGAIPGNGTHVVTGTITITPKEESK
jgi:hypothetical protein